MALKVLEMIAGTPYDCKRRSSDKAENYGFAPAELQGQAEKTVLAEAACWELVCTKESIYDDEEWGKEETYIGEDKTPFPDCEGEYILWQGRFVGFKYDGMIFFLPQGQNVGGNHRYFTLKETNRSDEYERYTFSVRKAAPSAQAVYYAAQEGNFYHTVYGIDPCAKDVVIEEGAVVLYCDVFKHCGALRRISLPASLKEITWSKNLFFEGTRSVETLTVTPENPIFYAEGNCLIERESMLLLGGTPTCVIPKGVKGISEFAFYRSSMKHITIPEGVETIGGYAFGQSDLESIAFPKAPIKIASSAFSYCRFLKKVYYAGTKEEWQASDLSKEFTRSAVYTYSEGKPCGEGDFWHYGENGEILQW